MRRAWLLLGAAIGSEVTGTMCLRATTDHVAFVPAVVVGYVASFVLLGLVLREGVSIGVAYGVWGATGVALTAVLGAVIFDETLSSTSIVGLGLIMVGVVLVETGSHVPEEAPA